MTKKVQSQPRTLGRGNPGSSSESTLVTEAIGTSPKKTRGVAATNSTAKENRNKGAYYLKKTIEHFKELGWQTQKFEVSIPFFIKGRAIFSRKDLLGADLFIWKGEECRLVQVKFVGDGDINTARSHARIEFDKYNVPLVRNLVIWEPKQKPIIEFI